MADQAACGHGLAAGGGGPAVKLYLDLCALKRPFDDRSQPRVDAEARVVLDLLGRVADGEHRLAWSPALTFENQADPDPEVRQVVAQCASLAEVHAELTEEVAGRIADLHGLGLAPLDAAHLAFAEAAGCDLLLTCDDRFQKRAGRIAHRTRVVNVVEWSGEQGHE